MDKLDKLPAALEVVYERYCRDGLAHRRSILDNEILISDELAASLVELMEVYDEMLA